MSRKTSIQTRHDRKAGPGRWAQPSGTDIKALRERLGFSRAEFAARYGLSRRALENWEQDRRPPNLAAKVLFGMIDRDPQTVAAIIQEIRAGEPGLD